MAVSTDLLELIEGGREGLSNEFKSSMPWSDAATKGKVIKAALGFANIRDGGVLIFGLAQKAGAPLHKIVGMQQEEFDSFSQDSVSALVNAHATPHIDLSVEHLTHGSNRLVAIVFRQFSDYPVICSKDYVLNGKAVVTRGRLYCRSRRTPETTEVQTPEDMRDIINLATARGLEQYFRQRQIEARFEGPTERERFDKQRGDL